MTITTIAFYFTTLQRTLYVSYGCSTCLSSSILALFCTMSWGGTGWKICPGCFLRSLVIAVTALFGSFPVICQNVCVLFFPIWTPFVALCSCFCHLHVESRGSVQREASYRGRSRKGQSYLLHLSRTSTSNVHLPTSRRRDDRDPFSGFDLRL